MYKDTGLERREQFRLRHEIEYGKKISVKEREDSGDENRKGQVVKGFVKHNRSLNV